MLIMLFGERESRCTKCRFGWKTQFLAFWQNLKITKIAVFPGIRRDGHLLFEVEMYLQKGCIMVSGVGSS